MYDSFIQQLAQRLQLPLPGESAHLKMAHAGRQLFQTAPPDARLAGVMATLFPKNEEWHLILIERKQIKGDKHGGQIGFPGGKFEQSDTSLLETALRETEEEIGISRLEVKVLGELTGVYIPVSNFHVYPFVGYLDYAPSYSLQESEVGAVLEVPVSHFQNSSDLRRTDIPIGGQIVLRDVPYFDVDGKILWGATAMMLSELVHVLDEVAQVV